MRLPFLLFVFTVLINQFAFSQNTSTSTSPRQMNHADSLYLARLNSNGNLLIAGGVGLCAAGGFLIYEGWHVYKTTAATIDDTNRNHRQGTIYYAAGGVAIAVGIVLTAFGARNKMDFKLRKKMFAMQTGILDDGNLGVALNF